MVSRMSKTVVVRVYRGPGELVAVVTLTLTVDPVTGVPSATDHVVLSNGWTYTTTGPIVITETATTFTATRTYVFTPVGGGDSITRTVTVTMRKPVTGAG